MVLLGAADLYLCYSSVNFVMQNGKSVLILFAFESGLLLVTLFNTNCRYSLWALDTSFSRGLTSKGLYVMLSDLVCDALRFITYLFFFSLVFVYYGLPIHIVREMGHSFYVLQKNARSFVKYLHLTRNLDQRFPDATEEELREAGDCLICREALTEGKKLGCNHIFHLECLRMWLQHQQSCPLCRADIPVHAVAGAGDARAQQREQAAQGLSLIHI